MKFLIDITSKKRKIVEKIKTGDFSFTEEEEFIFKSDIDLKKIAFDKLSSGRESWTKEAHQFFKENVQSEDLEYLKDSVFYYACLAEIDSSQFSDLEDLLAYTTNFEGVEKYLEEKLQDPNYRPHGTLTGFVMNSLIKCNRYDLLWSVNQYYQDLPLTSEAMKLVAQNYPYDYTTLPFKIEEELIPKDYEALNVYELFRLFSNDEENIFPILKRKLFESNPDLRQPFYARYPLDKFYDMLDEEERAKFRRIMMYNKLTWYINRAPREELIANIPEMADLVRKNVILFKNPIKNQDILLQSREFMEALLETANYRLLFSSPLINEYIPRMIAFMDAKNEHYVNNWTEDGHYFTQFPEVFRAALRNGCNFDLATIEYRIQGKELYSIMLEEAYQNKSVFRLPNIAEVSVKKFILSGNIRGLLKNVPSNVLNSSTSLSTKLTDEECVYFINGIKDDFYLQNNVLTSNPNFIFDNPQILDFYLHSAPMMLENIIDYINHHEDVSFLYTDELYHTVKEYYAEKYHLNIEKLDKLEHRFGPTIIRFMDNETLSKITSLDDDKFEKLINLFPDEKFTMAALEATFDSLKQYAFSKENPDIISIFAHIKHSLEDGNEDYKEDLTQLISAMDEGFYKKFGKKYPSKVDICRNDTNAFLMQIVEQLKSLDPVEKEEAINILHTITDYYIATKREEYRKSYNMIEELRLPYELDEKDVEKKVMFYLMSLNVSVVVDKEEGKEESIVGLVLTELVKNGMDSLLAIDVVAYYLKQDFKFTNDLATIQKNMRFAIPVIKKIVAEYVQGSDYYAQKFDEAGAVKRKYYVPSTELDMYQILTTLRIDSLEKNVLDDNPKANAIYNSLLSTMEKYKLHVMPPCFTKLLDSPSVQISSDLTNLSGFISYYHQVYENEKRKLESQGKDTSHVMLSITNILINAGVLSSVSSVYKQFLGPEDARLVKVNPGPNYATLKTAGDGRLKEAVEWTLKNFNKMEVTIPTFSEVVSLGENKEKQMRVIVGNFTHPSNITHGERTGACMRIGGVGETLFNFCLDDKNGFHIRFEDEATGEYISRVSGFRNGNTVFLNELRHSCNNELYNDEEIIEACKKIASTMIEMSKDSTCPIQNVVVARAYATENLSSVGLGISNNKNGLKAFYSDIQNDGIVLSSTGEPYTKIDFDKSKVPTYLPAREKTYVGTDTIKLTDMINRVHSVKRALAGTNYEYVEPISFDNEIVYGLANQDWYICMDSLGNTYEEFISIDKRALEELETARKMIAEYVPTKVEDDTYQY